jgi:hypothetical protein
VSGLTLEKASNIAPNIFNDHSENDTAVLQIGTTEIERSSVEQITSKYTKLIESVSQVAPSTNVVMTAVPQRVSQSGVSANAKIDKVNSFLNNMCVKQKRFHFINANPPLQKVNYKDDGYHFSQKGTSYFARYVGHYISRSTNFPKLPFLTQI